MNLELLASSVLAGLFAAFSPCCIPVYPVLLNIIASDGKNRRMSAIGFSVGLMLTFIAFYTAFGITLKWLGEAANDLINTIYVLVYFAAALMCFGFALQSMGKLNVLNRSYVPRFSSRGGLFGAVLSGALFASIISPCNLGFIIAGILPILLAKTTVLEGLLYMSAFSISLSAPILILGLLSGYAMDVWLRRHMRKIELASIVFLIMAGAYFLYTAATLLSASA